MRLKEIEERLAAIKNELTTRAAELKEEEITALENEVTALQEESTGIYWQQQRNVAQLLERIAAGESVGDGWRREQIPRCLEISREQAAQEQENQRTNTTLRHTEKRL